MAERNISFDSSEPMEPAEGKRPSIIVLGGHDLGRQYFLARGETLIGRDDECAVRLSDACISQKHSKIVGDPGHTSGPYFRIIDLNSADGTFLNDQKIKEAVLTDGDRIRIGHTVLKYTIRDIADVKHENRFLRMATTDILTKLHSREYFLQQYSDLFHRSERYQRPFSLMMIDIDDFKTVNDAHGQAAGDLVLEKIGRIILELLRHEDFAARYGGEEFAILLPETGPREAHHPAERIRRTIEKLQIEADDAKFCVTVSIGLAGYPEHAGSLDQLMERADAALREAKASGKNCTGIFQPD